MEAPACRAGRGWARKAEDGREDVGSCWEWGSAVGTCCLVAKAARGPEARHHRGPACECEFTVGLP